MITNLNQAVPCFQEAIRAILGKELAIAELGVETLPRLRFNCQSLVNIGICNQEWQGLMVVGATIESFSKLVGEADLDICLDAIGEVMNATAGSFAGLPEVIPVFGELMQTTPMNMGNGTVFPKAESIQVDLSSEAGTFRFGFAIRAIPNYASQT